MVFKVYCILRDSKSGCSNDFKCMYVCMCACVYVYMYMYVCMSICTTVMSAVEATEAQ